MIGQVHAEDRSFVWTRFQDRVAGKAVPHRCGFRFVRQDGAVRHWEIDSYASAPSLAPARTYPQIASAIISQ